MCRWPKMVPVPDASDCNVVMRLTANNHPVRPSLTKPGNTDHVEKVHAYQAFSIHLSHSLYGCDQMSTP